MSAQSGRRELANGRQLPVVHGRNRHRFHRAVQYTTQILGQFDDFVAIEIYDLGILATIVVATEMFVTMKTAAM